MGKASNVALVPEIDDERDGGFEKRGMDRDYHEISPDNFNLDPYGTGGFVFRNKPIANLDRVVDQLTYGDGRVIDNPNGVITYTFASNDLVGLYNNPNFGFTAGLGFAPFSASQEAAARTSIGMWDDLVSVSFRETQGRGADITFANSSDPDQAYAYPPVAGRGWQFQSDVFTRTPSENWTNEWFTPGGYGNTTLVHEIGHSLGLSHPGNYNGAGATTYINQAEYAQDSMQYTIMSYWSGGETGASTVNWTLFLNNYAQTPMLHDIYAIQSVYGADTTTRTGDNVYGFGSNSGYEVYDFAQNPYPYLSIYDANGIDTIDLSGYTASQFLDLHAGSFSSVGASILSFADVNAARVADGFGPISLASYNSVTGSRNASVTNKIAADTGVTGITASSYDNLSIAYGVTIENGTGGSNKDVIWGNQVANTLKGLAGNDVINGFEGNDIIIGGLGADRLTGGAGADTFVFGNLELGDLITDFTSIDEIDLSGLGDLSWIGGGAFSGVAGQLNYTGGVLSADTNGDLTADFSVTLQGMPALHVDQLTFV